MKNKIATLLALIFISEPSAFASKCIALTNESRGPVQFDSLISPYTYTVKPDTTTTLSRDHMLGACNNSKTCTVTIKAENAGLLVLNDLPRGTHIIYSDPNKYFLDKSARVHCK